MTKLIWPEEGHASWKFCHTCVSKMTKRDAGQNCINGTESFHMPCTVGLELDKCPLIATDF